MGTIYTIGYGSDKKVKFQRRLREAFPDGVVIVDVRREGSHSRSGKWAWCGWGVDKMAGTVGDAGCGYALAPEAANSYVGTDAMRKYAELLRRPESAIWMYDLACKIMEYEKPACLLCAERKPFKENGEPNCHRVPLADAIAGCLDGYRVEHVE